MKEALAGCPLVPSRRSTIGWCIVLALAGVLGLLLAACSGSTKAPSSAPLAETSTTPTPASQEAAQNQAAKSPPQKLLKVEPVRGFVGDSFKVTGEGLRPGQPVEFQWVTWEGSYATQAIGNSIQFQERTYTEKRVSLGRAMTDDQGRVSAALAAPEDFGEVHDIYGVVDGADVARGGFRVLRSASITPTAGPVGTPITIAVTGLGWKPFESTAAVRYDNAYTGFVSAVTTKGSATFHIRAAGAAGPHTIQLTTASAGLPFLNNQESSTAHIPYMDMRFTFTVTGDEGPPKDAVEWPHSDDASSARAKLPQTTTLPGVSARLEPAAGPILSRPTFRASGLPAETELSLVWVTSLSNNTRGLQSLADVPMKKAVTGPDGSLNASVEVPDGWGGWQLVKLVQGSKAYAQVPFYVEWSLVGVTPSHMKSGDQFTVQVKGGGWTELDKGFAVTYDNSYIGYACSATSSGDITLNLVATGNPGTHLIDIYPMIYRDKGAHPPEFWNFELPQLTALQDHPGLGLGYRLPAFRLAIEVVE